MQINCERRKRGVVGEPLEKFADVGDPEGALEAGANFLPTIGEAQERS